MSVTVVTVVSTRPVAPPPPLPPDYTFVRVLHEAELPPDLRTTPRERPEVRPFFPNHHSPFGRDHQLLSKACNPLCSPGNWTAGYHYRLWVANNQGFGIPGDPRVNFVTGQNVGAPLPRVEALTCGGNVLRVLGEIRTKTDRGLEDCWQVECLDWRKPAPPLAWLQARPWLVTVAVNLGGDLTPRRFEQGKQPDGFIPGFFHPFLADSTRYTLAIAKWRCKRWTLPVPPDPYRVYG